MVRKRAAQKAQQGAEGRRVVREEAGEVLCAARLGGGVESEEDAVPRERRRRKRGGGEV